MLPLVTMIVQYTHAHTRAQKHVRTHAHKEEAEIGVDGKDPPQPCRGHCSSFSSSTLSFTSTVSQHFPSSFCSATLSLLTLSPSPFLLTSNALSHHRSHSIQVFPPLTPVFHVPPTLTTTTTFSSRCLLLVSDILVLDF